MPSSQGPGCPSSLRSWAIGPGPWTLTFSLLRSRLLGRRETNALSRLKGELRAIGTPPGVPTLSAVPSE